MAGKQHPILEVKEQLYKRYPDLVERVRKAQESIDRARDLLQETGMYREEAHKAVKRDVSWLSER